MIGRGAGSAAPQSTRGGPKGVNFSRAVTAADTVTVTLSVALPRSTKPIAAKFTISAGTALISVQGNGIETYGDQVGPNIPTVLPLDGFPETTYVVITVEQLAASTLAGTLYYN